MAGPWLAGPGKQGQELAGPGNEPETAGPRAAGEPECAPIGGFSAVHESLG